MLKREMKAKIIDLSIQYSIVTQFTSFVAIEEREEVSSSNEIITGVPKLYCILKHKILTANISVSEMLMFSDPQDLCNPVNT